jgi:hypothetical protein
VNQSSLYRPRRLHGEQADVTAVPDCLSRCNHLARSLAMARSEPVGKGETWQSVRPGAEKRCDN